jgi:hypothetical protein
MAQEFSLSPLFCLDVLCVTPNRAQRFTIQYIALTAYSHALECWARHARASSNSYISGGLQLILHTCTRWITFGHCCDWTFLSNHNSYDHNSFMQGEYREQWCTIEDEHCATGCRSQSNPLQLGTTTPPVPHPCAGPRTPNSIISAVSPT